MIKNECEIVKDLIPSYIENLVSEGTKEFVEKHIKTCDSCKDTLENNKKEKVGRVGQNTFFPWQEWVCAAYWLGARYGNWMGGSDYPLYWRISGVQAGLCGLGRFWKSL